MAAEIQDVIYVPYYGLAFFLYTGEYVDLPSVFSWQLEVSQWKKNSVFSFIIIHCKPPLKGTKDYFLRLITADMFLKKEKRVLR